jgi:23S rRNA (cytosine1962-C5)-methyltransferase
MSGSAYAMLDLGGGGRLERFGDRIVDRPAPGAYGERHDPETWRTATLRFDRDRGWSGSDASAGPWPVEIAGVTMELRATDAGQVGLFPEHVETLPWLLAQGGGTVLSLFAYTGLATLAMARAGVAVTHVDASRPAVSWARLNAERSGLRDRPVRWIVDDAPAFVGREARRGRRYDGLVLDPPSYGHGPTGQPWSMERLPDLLTACRAVLAPDGFAMVTAHTPGYDPDRLAAMLVAGLGRAPAAVASGDLAVASADGRRLELGAFARTGRVTDRAEGA